MRFDWKPESKERYFRKAEAAVKALSTSTTHTKQIRCTNCLRAVSRNSSRR